MIRQVKQVTLLASAAIALSASLWPATDAAADQDTPQFHRGACQGAYPGWLRGVADGYNDLASRPVKDASGVLQKVPTPAVPAPGDERLGFGDGLQAGFKLGVEFGVELAKAARTADSDSLRMDKATAQLGTYIKRHCGELVATLDWETTFMNAAGTSTVASLNEAQVAMSMAAHANQAAIGAEKLVRGAQEAEAKGDRLAAIRFRAAAQASAQLATNFAGMARSHAATGREEAVQAIIDAQAAADRARKAVEGAGG